ncbi:hypothetical protein SAY87_030772 [Trapa incisa]|uniref:Fold protein n=1 Tax=Trapa incisa TaxID=236973 RepID=A0AAN7QNN3_9MYRT|nr:hypothetical protein SAY87_030772 [Trapa incisa]
MYSQLYSFLLLLSFHSPHFSLLHFFPSFFSTLEVVIAMASDESDEGQGHPHHQHNHATQGQALSRLSVCSSSLTFCNDTEDGDDDGMFREIEMCMSGLSIESFDADEEPSDDQKTQMTSDSDGERECYSLPATPPKRRRGSVHGVKDYASENEEPGKSGPAKPRKSARRRTARQNIVGNGSGRRGESYWNGISGESEGGCGVGVLVITRPKGGKRPLCMDLEEVKACRDLGFELEHERMFEIPSRLSVSGSNLDTNSSGGNSPISNWRISSPGDDPRDVKARLKLWAQAVAFMSTSQTTHNSTN